MNPFSAIVVFVLIWWMVFFCTLPFGIEPIEKPQGGTMPGAPVQAGIKKKVLVSTVITIVLWGIAYWLITSDLLSFRDMAQRMAM